MMTHQKSPLETMTSNLSCGGATVEFKRKRPDGSLQDTDEKQLALLHTKSQVASTAHGLQNLSDEERTAWALEMKDYANELYRNQMFSEALEKYVEALTASNFGKKATSSPKLSSKPPPSEIENNESGNIDSLVLPTLCNMAACCIQLKKWPNAVQLCDQALQLRSTCSKALMRRGIAFLNIGEYKLSLESFKLALQSADATESTPAPIAVDVKETSVVEGGEEVLEEQQKKFIAEKSLLTITEADKGRIQIFMAKAKKGLQAEKDAYAAQKKSLQRGFTSEGASSGVGAAAPSQTGSGGHSLGSALLALWHLLVRLLAALRLVKAQKSD